MPSVSFSTSFRRQYLRKIKGNLSLEAIFWQRMVLFVENPFTAVLCTHRLSGALSSLWSFNFSPGYQAVFYFSKGYSETVLVDLGPREEVF